MNSHGIHWDITFYIDATEYRWCGAFDTAPHNGLKARHESKIIFEKLYQHETMLVDRTATEMSIEGKLIGITPASSQSIIKILASDSRFSAIYEGFQKILLDQFYEKMQIYTEDYQVLKQQLNSLNKIRQSYYLSTQEKLLLVYQNTLDVFEQLKADFISVFPQVEDVVVDMIKPSTTSQSIIEVMIKLKVYGVDKWVEQPQISAGMLKTLLLISQFYLSPDGTVLLIDEFENSLGVNCIDIIDDLVTSNKQLQLIITSHHPYVINSIPMDEWKIVTRKGGTVTVKDAKDFKQLGRSSHERFMQLIQLDEVRNGVRPL